MIKINEHILQAIYNSKAKLSEEAINLIADFISSQIDVSGGFINRNGKPDPYYSVFGYTLAYVFEIPLDIKKEKQFLLDWSEQNELDFVHTVSLLRCHLILTAIKYQSEENILSKGLKQVSFIKEKLSKVIIEKTKKEFSDLFGKVYDYRSEDGGYNHFSTDSKTSTVYANFLALGLLSDFNDDSLAITELSKSIKNLEKDNGSFVNEESSINGVTSSTSAGTIIKHLTGENADKNLEWLRNQQNDFGGFSAAENISLADLLSTSTALMAIKICDSEPIYGNSFVEDFIISHLDDDGGFFGSFADMKSDCEYTFYGLLALGLV